MKLYLLLKIMHYNNINFSVITDIELIQQIKNNFESEYININNIIYSVNMCEIDNITYIMSTKKYKSFKNNLSDFYEGKIVKII